MFIKIEDSNTELYCDSGWCKNKATYILQLPGILINGEQASPHPICDDCIKWMRNNSPEHLRVSYPIETNSIV